MEGRIVAYIEEYADQVRAALADVPNVTESKMFGSLGFMINGNLAIGVGDSRDGSVLMVRVGKDNEGALLSEPGASVTRMGKKVMHGWIDLTPEAVGNDKALQRWIGRATSFVETLPPKGQ